METIYGGGMKGFDKVVIGLQKGQLRLFVVFFAVVALQGVVWPLPVSLSHLAMLASCAQGS